MAEISLLPTPLPAVFQKSLTGCCQRYDRSGRALPDTPTVQDSRKKGEQRDDGSPNIPTHQQLGQPALLMTVAVCFFAKELIISPQIFLQRFFHYIHITIRKNSDAKLGFQVHHTPENKLNGPATHKAGPLHHTGYIPASPYFSGNSHVQCGHPVASSAMG